MSELEAIRKELEVVKGEISKLAAENLAVQFILTSFFQRLGEANASVREPILQAFNDAADNAESFSIIGGRQSGHLPETLRIIEQLRTVLAGQSKPKDEI